MGDSHLPYIYNRFLIQRYRQSYKISYSESFVVSLDESYCNLMQYDSFKDDSYIFNEVITFYGLLFNSQLI